MADERPMECLNPSCKAESEVVWVWTASDGPPYPKCECCGERLHDA